MVSSLLFLGAAALARSAEVIVDMPLGSVSGVDEGDFLVFKGMRYAEPPGRFEVSEPKKPWNGTVSAQDFGAPCFIDTEVKGLLGMSEDCLYANVWAPHNAHNLPVVVFIHGGGFIIGSGADARNWGDEFVQDADHPVVYVTINYRMGILGFFSSSEQGANFGLQDQQESLRWVRDNIAAFGGDPSSVTLIGQSAGAMAVQTHLVAPGSQGLFHRAFLASTVGLHYRSLSEGEANVKSAAEAVGCLGVFREQVKCMRAKPASLFATTALVTGFVFHVHSGCKECNNILPWGPVVDGLTLPRSPLDMISDGSHARVPVIISTVRNESFAFIPGILHDGLDIKLAYNQAMGAVFRDNADAVKAHYAEEPDGAAMHLTSRLGLAVTDALWTCYGRYVARLLAKSSPTYLSLFMHAPSAKADPENGALDAACQKGATCHAGDLNWVFPHSPEMKKQCKLEYTEEEEALAATYSSAIRSFAYGDITSWVQYSEASDLSTVWGDSSYDTMTGYHSSHCDFWESIGFPTDGWGATPSTLSIVV